MKDGSELLAHFQNIKDKGGGKYTCDCPICNRKEHVYISIERDSAAMFCHENLQYFLDCDELCRTFG